MNYVIARMKEASTWRGLVAMVSAFGVSISPELAEAIVATGLGIIGIIGVFFPDAGAK